MNKIQTQDEIVKIVHELKKQGKKIVTFNGSFDILHVGHIKSIQEAKNQGDILIILLNSDASIKQYKSSMRPFVPQDERAYVLSAFEPVDYVVLFDEITPIKILKKIKPSIHCNGADWGKDCIEKDVVEKNDGSIHVLNWFPGFSTSKVAQKLTKSYGISLKKAVFIDRDGTINSNKNGYVHKIEDFEFLPHVTHALQLLSKTTFKIVVVTNQSGIGRGYYTQNDFDTLNTWMIDTLKKEKVRIDAIYYCPHREEDNCNCRKPEIGMLKQAVKEFDISLNESWVVGDDEKDVIMGRSANTKTIKIGAKMHSTYLQPNYYVQSLPEAIDIILKDTKEKGYEK